MNNAWQKYVDMASGMTELTRQRAETVVRTLVKQGEVAADRAERTVDELLARSEQNRKAVSGIVRSETERAIGRLGLARKREVERLQAKVDQLERQVGSSGAASPKKAQKKVTKKTTKKAAKKSAAAKRSGAQKSGQKKSGQKKST